MTLVAIAMNYEHFRGFGRNTNHFYEYSLSKPIYLVLLTYHHTIFFRRNLQKKNQNFFNNLEWKECRCQTSKLSTKIGNRTVKMECNWYYQRHFRLCYNNKQKPTKIDDTIVGIVKKRIAISKHQSSSKLSSVCYLAISDII